MNKMSKESIETPKLSLVAQFDDMCRFANSLISVDERELINLINNSEANRLKWLLAERQLAEMRINVEKLEEENKSLSCQLQRVRLAFGSEVQKREELLKQKHALNSHLNAIKDFVLEDPITNQSQYTKDKVLSYFNLNRLETVNEENASSGSLSGLEYDKTEEMLDESINRSKRKRVSTNSQPIEKSPNKSRNNGVLSMANDYRNEEIFDTNVELDSEMIARNQSFAQPKSEVMSNLRYTPISQSSPYIKTLNIRPFNPSSQDLTPSRGSNRLEERKHSFQQKKAFKPLYCGPCGKSIGFCGTCLCCSDCRAICHISCKDKLPLPCIPFRKPNGKSSRMALIADFAPQNTRPMIPALIIHCCNEIEKRGLDEEGLYRKCGSDKEVRELKEKILNSKSGIPMLAQYDVHVLCGVVKQFLRELDEPIVTRILWRDFSRAADQENPDDERALTMQTVAELPIANRDSLAFIIVHLQRIAQSKNTLMDSLSLAKVFGPTIVGYSMIDPPITELLAENPKQIKVMDALLRVPEDFWNSIISSTNYEQNQYGSPDRRVSLGTRLFGDVRRGTVTPQRSAISRKGSLSLKPLF